MTTSPLFDRAVSKLCSILESYDLTDRADKIRRAGDANALLRAIDRAGDVANDRAGVALISDRDASRALRLELVHLAAEWICEASYGVDREVCGKQALLLLSWSEQDLARMAEESCREKPALRPSKPAREALPSLHQQILDAAKAAGGEDVGEDDILEAVLGERLPGESGEERRAREVTVETTLDAMVKSGDLKCPAVERYSVAGKRVS